MKGRRAANLSGLHSLTLRVTIKVFVCTFVFYWKRTIASEVMEVDEVLADMTLEVDATEAPSHWLRSRMIFHHYLAEILKPNRPTADIILHYPKWMPSTHAPGLRFECCVHTSGSHLSLSSGNDSKCL